MPAWFSNPMLLAGLAALAIPVLLHLIIREERSGQAFPSLMFIRRTPYESRRRRTLRDRALLALRCLALALVVLAFAGPELLQERETVPLSDWSKDTVLLLDRSASMSPPERWRTALDAARQRVEQLSGGERMAIVAFDHDASLVAPLQADPDTLRVQLDGLRTGSGDTRLGAAFNLAARLLRESSSSEEQHILLISDLQESALEQVDRLILDQRVGFEVLAVDTPVDRNAAIMSVSLQQRRGSEHTLSIRLRNTGIDPMKDLEFRVEIEDRIIDQQRIDLLPQAEQTLLVPVVLAPDRAVAGRVVLAADRIAADNLHHLVLMPDPPVDLALLLDGDRSATAESALFVEHAVRLARNPAIQTIPLARDADRLKAIRRADIVIADASSAADRDLNKILQRFVADGGGLLMLMDDAWAADDREPTADETDLLRGIGELRRFTGKGTGIRLPPDTAGHALWRGIAGDIAAALAGTRILMARDFDVADALHSSKVLARLSDGEPWLVEQAIGRGRLLILTTGLGGIWGNLVLEAGFVPMLHETLRYLARRPPIPLTYTLGDVVDLGRQAANLPGDSDWSEYLAAGGSLVVEPPGGGQRRLAAGERLYQTGAIGVYQVHRADGHPPSLLFAVNPAPGESLLAAASEATLKNRITRRPAPPQAGGTAEEQAGSEAGPPPGWYLLGFAAILFWLEAQLANRLSRRRLEGSESRPTGTTAVEHGGG